MFEKTLITTPSTIESVNENCKTLGKKISAVRLFYRAGDRFPRLTRARHEPTSADFGTRKIISCARAFGAIISHSAKFGWHSISLEGTEMYF